MTVTASNPKIDARGGISYSLIDDDYVDMSMMSTWAEDDSFELTVTAADIRRDYDAQVDIIAKA